MRFVAWPAEKKAIDIGSFYSCSDRLEAATGWRPAVPLRDGLARTIAFYREHLPRYVEASAAPPDDPS
jgi:UDP-glucose 4-epimerase